MQVMEFLRKCSEWRENITNLGLQGALRNFLDPHFVEGSCSHSYFVSSRENERPSEGTVMCQECKRPMKNFVPEAKLTKTIDTADTTRGAKSALVPMAARKATSADTVDTIDMKQENLLEHSEEHGFATGARLGWLYETPRGGSRAMAVTRVSLRE
ncbi:hypothetical protein JHK87_040011 [Glycine soja]|nr:hypothetical protein JHK87_040011 [Glycine soja]